MRVSTSLRNASLVLVLLSTFAAWLSGRNLAAQNPSSDTSAKLAADLQSRAKQYLDFRKRVAGNAPRPTATPAKITAVQRQLADKVRVARAGAKQGEVFTPEITEYLDGRDGNHIRASLRHAEPVSITLQINQSYPDNVPLQSTPPSLLLSLPELPAGLEYRLVGRELVLRDVDANIVVDYVANALPDRK